MSTWGSYFSSYVKKKPAGEAAEATPKVDTSTEKSMVSKVDISVLNAPGPVAATTIATVKPPARKPTGGFQRANSNAKKLYEIPKEPVMKDVLAGQKAASNASRVAKMFGYAASAYTPPVEEPKPALPVSPLIAMVEAAAPRPEPTVDRPVSPLKAMVEAAAPKKSEPKVMPIVDAVLKYKKENTSVSAKPKSKKEEVQDMLDFFASQLDAPNDALALPSDRKVNAGEPNFDKAKEKEAATKPIKPKTMDMLDFFSSQLDSPNDTLALPGDKKAEAPTHIVKTKPKAVDMLSFFSTQLDSADDLFALPGDKKTEAPKPVVKEQPRVLQREPPIAPLTRKDSGWSSQGSNTSQELKMIMSSPQSRIWSPQTSRTSSELNSVVNGGKDSVWSQQGSPTSSERAMSIKKRTSLIEQDVVQIRGRILSYGENDEQLKLERERRDAEHERIVELQTQAQQIILEREQMDMERDRMLEEQLRFEKEAQRIAEEAESMRKFVKNVERERQLDLENQEKKRRRKEAEEQARREVEEAERRRIEAEQEAERFRLEMEEEARREAELAAELEEAERAAREIEKERKRVEEIQRKGQYKAKEDRLAKEEADRLTAKMRKYEEEKATGRRYYEEEEERKRDVARQKEADRQEYEEEQERKREVGRQRRLAAKERQEQEDRLRYEQEAAEEARAIEEEKIEKQQRREAERRADQLFKEEEERRLFEQEQERQLYKQEQAERRYEQEQAERSRAGAADKLADAYRFDLNVASKPMLSPSVYEDEQFVSDEEEEREETKEEKLAKAEEKIRMAFAGLAQERGQQVPAAPVPAAAALPRSNTVRDDRGPGGYGGFGGGLQPSMRQEKGVSRYNTTGGAAKLQKRVAPQVGLVKVNTVSGRPGGLPSGPRAGGLPGGPRPVRR